MYHTNRIVEVHLNTVLMVVVLAHITVLWFEHESFRCMSTRE
jgi:hypothetical protein